MYREIQRPFVERKSFLSLEKAISGLPVTF